LAQALDNSSGETNYFGCLAIPELKAYQKE